QRVQFLGDLLVPGGGLARRNTSVLKPLEPRSVTSVEPDTSGTGSGTHLHTRNLPLDQRQRTIRVKERGSNIALADPVHRPQQVPLRRVNLPRQLRCRVRPLRQLLHRQVVADEPREILRLIIETRRQTSGTQSVRVRPLQRQILTGRQHAKALLPQPLVASKPPLPLLGFLQLKRQRSLI